MTHRDLDSERRPIAADVRRHRVFYEMYPSPPEAVEERGEQWLEIALHAEVGEQLRRDHPETHQASLLLIGIADYLVQRVQCQARFALELPASYFTILPAGPAEQTPRIALTLSVVFSRMEPTTPEKELALRMQVREELASLGVRHGSGEAGQDMD